MRHACCRRSLACTLRCDDGGGGVLSCHRVHAPCRWNYAMPCMQLGLPSGFQLGKYAGTETHVRDRRCWCGWCEMGWVVCVWQSFTCVSSYLHDEDSRNWADCENQGSLRVKEESSHIILRRTTHRSGPLFPPKERPVLMLEGGERRARSNLQALAAERTRMAILLPFPCVFSSLHPTTASSSQYYTECNATRKIEGKGREGK